MGISNGLNKKSILKFIAIIILFAVIFGAGAFYGQRYNLPVLPSYYKIINQNVGAPKDLDFSLFWDTWQSLKDNYVDPTKLDEQKMLYGAISGMVKSLGDPYTVFMDPTETKQFDQDLSGVFDGIGAELGMKNNIITIIAPLPDTPAEKAGLMAGDKIYKIGDTVTTDLSLDEAVTMIRGPKGTTVTLTIVRGKETETREFKIVRDTIVVKSVELKFQNTDKGKIAILKISRFGEDTFSGVQASATEILKQNSKGIILDLRNNPGGYLETAVDVAGVFLPSKQLVLMQKSNNSKQDYFTNGKNELGKIPLVMLANGGSASASEILAGALKDDRGIKLVGEKTFGKGLVQQIFPLTKDQSTLKITISEWFTPSGKNINKEGLSPDIPVELTPADFDAGKDPQMDAALKELAAS